MSLAAEALATHYMGLMQGYFVHLLLPMTLITVQQFVISNTKQQSWNKNDMVHSQQNRHGIFMTLVLWRVLEGLLERINYENYMDVLESLTIK